MSAEECVNEITSELKYWVGVYKQSTASRIVKRFREGTITLNKLEEFLNAFGYVKRGSEWIKVKTERPEMSYK